MAEKDIFLAELEQSKKDLSGQCGLAAPSADSHSVLQDRLSFSTLNSNERTVQPFPRSPKLKKKMENTGPPSQVKATPKKLQYLHLQFDFLNCLE